MDLVCKFEDPTLNLPESEAEFLQFLGLVLDSRCIEHCHVFHSDALSYQAFATSL